MATLETRILGGLRDQMAITSEELATALGEDLATVEEGCNQLKRQLLLAEERRGLERLWSTTALWQRRERILGLLEAGAVETPDLADALGVGAEMVRNDCQRLRNMGLLTKTLEQRRQRFQVFPVTLEVVITSNSAAVEARVNDLKDIVKRHRLTDPQLVAAMERYLDGLATFLKRRGMAFRIGIFKSRLLQALRAGKSKEDVEALFTLWRRSIAYFYPESREVLERENYARIDRWRRELDGDVDTYFGISGLVPALSKRLEAHQTQAPTAQIRGRIKAFEPTLLRVAGTAVTESEVKHTYGLRPIFPEVASWRLTADASALTPSPEDPHHLLEAA